MKIIMKPLLLITIIAAIVFLSPIISTAAQKTLPEEYLRMKNPFDRGDKTAIERGETLYMRRCISCHGEKGDGKGPVGEDLEVVPYTKEGLSKKPDGYLFWVIEKGVPETGMPDFGPGSDLNLPSEDIWKVIAFLRERFGK